MPWVNVELCNGCGTCVEECPVGAIELTADGFAEIDEAECIRCGRCHDACPQQAVRHDGERTPQDVAENLRWVRKLLGHFKRPEDQSAFMDRMVRFFNKQKKVSERTLAAIAGAAAGYESEPAHNLCRNELGIVSIFPTTHRGRPRLDGKPNTITGRYRREMLDQFPKKTYGQRWQVETAFSMLKRLLGSALRTRKPYAINREIILRVLTINLMIVLHLITCFQQSRTITYLFNALISPRFK